MGRRQGSGSDRPGLGAVPCLWLATQGTPQVLCTSHQRPSPRNLGLTCTTLHHVLVNDVLVSGYRYFDRYLRLSMSPLNAVQHQRLPFSIPLMLLFFLHFRLLHCKFSQSLLLFPSCTTLLNESGQGFLSLEPTPPITPEFSISPFLRELIHRL